MAGEAGKGSKRRPKQVSDETEAENWRRIFGMDEKEDQQDDEKKESE